MEFSLEFFLKIFYIHGVSYKKLMKEGELNSDITCGEPQNNVK